MTQPLVQKKSLWAIIEDRFLQVVSGDNTFHIDLTKVVFIHNLGDDRTTIYLDGMKHSVGTFDISVSALAPIWRKAVSKK